jgi:hypothetical protein
MVNTALHSFPGRSTINANVEDVMKTTAVGLFAQSETAEAVVNALRESGIASDEIRVLARPVASSVDSATSTPGLDFVAALAEDLRSMGANDSELEAYLDGVRNGNVLVFASGNAAQADSAAQVMNRFEPAEMHELAGAIPELPAAHVGEVGTNILSMKGDRARAQATGARVFTW